MNKSERDSFAKKILLQIDLRSLQIKSEKVYAELSSQSKGMEVKKITDRDRPFQL